ncbi:MAG: hypothetical protein ABI873_15180 [Marmoricola sp.]
MGWAFWALAGVLLAVAVLAVTLAVRLGAERKRTRGELQALMVEHDQLRSQVADLTRTAQALREDRRGLESGGPDYVITRVGDTGLTTRDGTGTRTGRRIPDRAVLSAAFGEPLVKALSFGHGVRRALSPESRNRIGFEMRREMRRSRKLRRREMREAWKQMRAQEGSPSTSSREDVA